MTEINNGITNVFKIIFSAQVNFTQATSDYVSLYLSDLLDNNDLPSSFDPSQLLSQFGTDGTSTDKFGCSSSTADPNIAMSLGVASSVASRRRRLQKLRFLAAQNQSAAVSTNMTSMTLNLANPKCLIPQDVTSKLPLGTKLTFSWVRDPKTYNNGKSPYLLSQVVTITAKNGTNNTNYPNSTVPLNLTIPWANKPLNCPNFQTNCKVYSVNNNGTWIINPACSLNMATDSNNAYINCKNFGTFSVSCTECNVNAKLLLLSASNKSISTNKTSSGAKLYISLMISAFLVIMII